MNRNDEQMTDKQLGFISRIIVFIHKLLKLVPEDMRDDLESEFDSILLDVTKTDNE